MNAKRKETVWPVWALLGLLLVFLGFSLGVLWEGRAGADSFILRTSPDYAPVPTAETGLPAGQMDINNASLTELTDLPGIGPVLAQRIVEYRTEHGPFSAPEDLMNIKGIGPAKLAKILPYIQLTGGAG